MTPIVKCSNTLIQDRYIMEEYQGLQDMLDTLRRHSEEGTEIVITDNYTNGRTNQKEEKVLHRFPTKEEFNEWVKGKFPKLQSSDDSEATEENNVE